MRKLVTAYLVLVNLLIKYNFSSPTTTHILVGVCTTAKRLLPECDFSVRVVVNVLISSGTGLKSHFPNNVKSKP